MINLRCLASLVQSRMSRLERFQPLDCKSTAGFGQASSFLEPGITPLRTHGFECQIEIIVRELGRSFLEWCFGAIEPESVESMPGSVRFNDHSFRRLGEKSMHSKVLTRFGNIELLRANYRRGRAGKVIAPVEKLLGIQCGATPAATDLVGRQIAATGSSQTRSNWIIADSQHRIYCRSNRCKNRE